MMILQYSSNHNSSNNNKCNSAAAATATASIALLSSQYRLQAPSAIRDVTILNGAREIGHQYEPSELDIFCGRGKGFYNRPGNKSFRTLVGSYIPAYLAAKTKVDKSAVLNTIVDKVRTMNDPVSGRPAQFIKFSKKTGWIEIGDEQAREKVGHAMREAISTFDDGGRVAGTTKVSSSTSSSSPSQFSTKNKMNKANGTKRKPFSHKKTEASSSPTPLPVSSTPEQMPVESINFCRQDSMVEELDASNETLFSEFTRQQLPGSADPTSMLWRPSYNITTRRGSSGTTGSRRSSYTISRDSMSSEMMRAAIESFIGI